MKMIFSLVLVVDLDMAVCGLSFSELFHKVISTYSDLFPLGCGILVFAIDK